MPFQTSSFDPSARCRSARTEMRQLSAIYSSRVFQVLSAVDAKRLFRCGARGGRRAVIEGGEPCHGRVAITGQPLVVDQRGMQIAQYAVHAPRPFRYRRQLAQADQVAANAENDGVAARQ